jgi:serine/threonine protein kinase/Tfp pilus assembly protein PilF
MIGKIISHYKILEKLGEGGMGVVYKAQDTKLGRIVALKFLPKHLLCDESAKTRFAHEAKAASALNHTNITTIYEIDEVEGECFICMEYVEGESIKGLIKEKTLSIQKILDISIQMAEGLNAAHRKGIVHRDIKSDNIMLTNEGLVKIMDFGLAKLKGVTKLTTTGATLGTLQYMSPEQAQGIEVDQRSDIFSFGVVLYEMITGQLPFKGEHEAAIIYSIINETSEPLARYKVNVPEGLQRTVDKALAKDRDERYQHIDDLLADLRRERKSLEYVKTKQVSPKPRKRLLPFIVPASIVLILALLFLILKPFKFEIVPEKGAIAKENSLAIMYFENMADPEDKDKIAQMITALLITGLSESPQYMQVVSSQRLYDILKLLGKEDLKVIDKTVASEVAKKAGVRWILTGKILQTKPNIVLISEISEATTGKIKATQRVSGATGEDLFAVVDKLSPQIAKALSLPEQAKKELNRPVANVTTHSQEAYRYYQEGVNYYFKYCFTDAEKSFRKALEFDSTFAMAYYWLAAVNTGPEQKKLVAKAVEYSVKASQKEKHYIISLDALISGDYPRAIAEVQKVVERYPQEKWAFFYLGVVYLNILREPEEAVRQFTRAIEIDPLFKDVYNNLAFAYNSIGDFEKSIWAINKYISLAPDEPNPYDSRGDIYSYSGKIDQAIESYKKALQIKSDFYMSLAKLGLMYLFKREYAQAESCFSALSASSDKASRSIGRTTLALVPLYQGKFTQALEVLDNGIVADKMEQFEGGPNAVKHAMKVFIYEERKNLDSALKEAEICTEIVKREYPFDPVYLRDLYIYILAKKGQNREAEEIAKSLKKGIGEKNQTAMNAYWLGLGVVEQVKGNKEKAISYLDEATKTPSYIATFSPITTGAVVWSLPLFQVRFLLARDCLESDRLDETVTELEKALSSYDENRAAVPISAVKAYYLLGLAYEKSGWNKKAIEKYEEFLDIWKNADPGIPEVEDARERLKKLTTP